MGRRMTTEGPDGRAGLDEVVLRHATSLGELLERRADLSGVVPMADLIRDAVTWAA